MWTQFRHGRSSHRRCSIKIGVLKNFAKFKGKHLCHSLFFNKNTLAQVFSCEFCKNFKNILLTEQLQTTASDTITILNSYFKDRKQNVKIKNFCSMFPTVPSGVPQGLFWVQYFSICFPMTYFCFWLNPSDIVLLMATLSQQQPVII